MSETANPSRRAALGALASIPALALPVAATAGAADVGQDAELFALIEEERALAATVNEALLVQDEAEDRTEYPETSQKLMVTEDDIEVLYRPKNGLGFWCESERKDLEGGLKMFGRVPLKNWVTTRPDLIAYQLRSAEILEALDQRRVAWELAEERSGLAEAERRVEALNAEHRQLWLRIAKTPARTPAGLLAKLSVVAAANCYQDEEDRDWENGSAEDILASLAVDAAAMKLGAAA